MHASPTRLFWEVGGWGRPQGAAPGLGAEAPGGPGRSRLPEPGAGAGSGCARSGGRWGAGGPHGGARWGVGEKGIRSKWARGHGSRAQGWVAETAQPAPTRVRAPSCGGWARSTRCPRGVGVKFVHPDLSCTGARSRGVTARGGLAAGREPDLATNKQNKEKRKFMHHVQNICTYTIIY